MLAWLLDETGGTEARQALASAELVLASCLTLIECDRVLIRGVATNLLPEGVFAQRRALLTQTAAHWIVLALDEEVVARARRPFPAEPIRTLDAIHLATATVGRSLVPDLALLSLDERVRASARAMGLSVLPDGA